MENLKLLWAEFIRKRVPISDYLKPHIADSWERSLSLGVDFNSPFPKVLPRSRLKERVEASKEYLEAVRPVIRCLFQAPEGLNCVVGYVDSEGYVLEVFGSNEHLEMLKALNFIPGANWREEYAGTTAVGITLSTRQPAQVLHAEHFCQELKRFSCTAVPVHDPDTDNMVGVMDFIFRVQYHHPSLIGMATQIARVIELTVEKNRREKEAIFRDYSIQLTLDHMEKGVLILDDRGCIRRINLKAMELLNLETENIVGSMASNIPALSDFWLNRTPRALTHLNGTELCLERKPIVHMNRPIGHMILIEATKAEPSRLSWIMGPLSVVGDSKAYRCLLEKAKNAARYDSNVLILGETGTGKEVMARFIHENSDRKNGPFVIINCGAIPKELLASELFGYEPGAFTGARQKGMAGKFELANNGTLVLDEVSEMPLDAQVYLLRVIEDRMVTRLGSSSARPVNVRLIAISNKDLRTEVEKGRFRADLLFRLNVIKIEIPPLRNRREDIITLSMHFLKMFSEDCKKRVNHIQKDALGLLLDHPWHGNVRELRNAIEHAVIMCEGETIETTDLPICQVSNENNDMDIPPEKSDNTYLMTRNAYAQCGGNITRMAKLLKVSRPTVYAWLKKYNIMKTF